MSPVVQPPNAAEATTAHAMLRMWKRCRGNPGAFSSLSIPRRSAKYHLAPLPRKGLPSDRLPPAR
jgi:hypothetical protein